MKTLIVLTLAGTALLTQQASDATRIFRAARGAEDAGKAEDAALRYREARRSAWLRAAKGEEAGLLAQLDEALARVDPDHEAREKAFLRYADQLEGIADRFRKKDWTLVSKRFHDMAGWFDPRHVLSDAVAARGKQKRSIHDWFSDYGSGWGPRGWSKKDAVLVAPATEGNESAGILNPTSIPPGYRIEVSLHLHRIGDFAGILIAMKGTEAGYMVDVNRFSEKGRELRLYEIIGTRFKRLLTREHQVAQEPGGGWDRFRIEVRREEISFRIDDMTLWAHPLPGVELRGQVGLAATTRGDGDSPTGFKDFSLEPLLR